MAKKQTPFTDMTKEVICVGDFILEKDVNAKPMKVCFGEYVAGKDDWSIDFVCYGFYVEFHDGGNYSLTQEGKGHSIAAMNSRIVIM